MTLNKRLLFVPIFMLSVFLFAPQIKAAAPYDQGLGTQYATNIPIDSKFSFYVSHDAGNTATKFYLKIKTWADSVACRTTSNVFNPNFDIKVERTSGTTYTAPSSIATYNITGAPEEAFQNDGAAITYEFDVSPNTVQGSYDGDYWWLSLVPHAYNGTCGGDITKAYWTMYEGQNSTNSYISNWNTGGTTGYKPWIYFDTTQPYNIEFHSGFSDGMVVPDFNIWQVDLTFPDHVLNPGWQIEYKNASSSSYTFNDEYEFQGYNNGAFSGVVSNLRKHTPLPAGNYEAAAVLFADHVPVALSNTLHFTVTDGAIINTPGTGTVPTTSYDSLFATSTPNTLFNDSGCTDTNFSVLGADFGKGICKVAAFLFVPGQLAVNQYTKLVTNLQNKIPFSYFYDVSQTITSQSPTGSGSPITTLDFVASTTALHLTYSPFSSSTAISYMGPTLFNFYQTLMRYAVYAGFGFGIWFSAKSLFGPKV